MLVFVFDDKITTFYRPSLTNRNISIHRDAKFMHLVDIYTQNADYTYIIHP